MKLPFTEKRYVRTLTRFRGIKAGHTAELCDLTAKTSGTLEPVPEKHKSAHLLSEPGGIGYDGAFFYASGGGFYYDGVRRGDLSPGQKQFAVSDGTVLIYPDKKYFRRETKYYRYAKSELVEASPSFTPADAVKLAAISDCAPETLAEGELSFDTARGLLYKRSQGALISLGAPSKEVFYSLYTERFGSLERTVSFCRNKNERIHIKTVAADGSEGNTHLELITMNSNVEYALDFSFLSPGEKVAITGLEPSETAHYGKCSKLMDGAKVVSVSPGRLIIENTPGIDKVNCNDDISGEVSFRKLLPELDCVMSVDGRIWGAKGEFIYSSRLNSVSDFTGGEGISAAYLGRTGLPDPILACADLGSIPVFLTRGAIIKAIRKGNTYELSITPASGIRPDSPMSAVAASGSLFYLSESGFMRYDGQDPKRIDLDAKLEVGAGVGGTDGTNYLFSDGDRQYVYDPYAERWHFETPGAYAYTRADGSAAFLVREGGAYRIITCAGEGECLPQSPSLALAPIDEGTLEYKTYAAFAVSAKLEAGGVLQLYAAYDGGAPVPVLTLRGEGKRSLARARIAPRRCVYLTLSFRADAPFELYSVSREYFK